MNTHRLACAFLFVLAALSPPSASADDVGSLQSDRSVAPSSCQIQSLRSDMALLTAPIRSQRDLRRHLRDARETDSPLDFLSPRAKRLFLSSLVFGDSGLSGYRYEELSRELTVSQAYQVLALFGAQDDVRLLPNLRLRTKLDAELRDFAQISAECDSGDRVNYQCVSRATCGNLTRYICKSNC